MLHILAQGGVTWAVNNLRPNIRGGVRETWHTDDKRRDVQPVNCAIAGDLE